MTGDFSELAAAYEGVDALDRMGGAQLGEYRRQLEARTAPEADFLERVLTRPAKVVEVGCGNGRLLIQLARRNAVRSATGFDLATSRIEFARRWTADVGRRELSWVAGDILTAEALDDDHDLALCVTGAFNYFDAARPGAAGELLDRLHAALAPGGRLVLELHMSRETLSLLRAARGDSLRVWHELPPRDPWRFYLSTFTFDERARVLAHRKIFVHRTTGEVDDRGRELLRVYDVDEFRGVLSHHGFSVTGLFDGWSTAEYRSGETLVAVANRT